MARSLQQLTDDAVKEGGVLARFYFDMHAQDKVQLQQLAVDFASKITQEQGVLYAHAEIEEPIEYEGLFSTNAEVHLLVQSFSTLMNLAVRYGPLGVEILKPNNNLKLSLGEAHEILLNAAQNSLEFSKYMLNSVANDEQKASFKKDMERRTEMGKRLLEKKGTANEKS